MENHSIDSFVKILAETKNMDKIKKLLNEILTGSELKNISLRWALMEQLSRKVPQRDIASRLGISLCKITRGAKLLKDKDSEVSKIFNKGK